MLEFFLGHRLATKISSRLYEKRLAHLQQTHDAWETLGINTRQIHMRAQDIALTTQSIQTGRRYLRQHLPPFFWNPPKHGPEEVERQLKKLGL